MTDERHPRKSSLVLTPGGYRDRAAVHGIKPGEVVFQDETGVRAMPDPNLVLTPGGFRDRSLVHMIEPDHALVVEPEKFTKLNLLTKTVTDLQQIMIAPAQAPVLGSGWIAYAYWNNGTGKTFNSFSTTWVVPPAPAAQANPLQTIFLFNGIQNFGANFGILQPVLQWGPSAAPGGGNYWSVASWYVTSGGQAFHTQLTRVNPGDTLVGLMTLVNSSAGIFSYQSEFQGFPSTKLPVQKIAELLWFNETLEAYSIQQCSNYPNTPKTSFTNIAINSTAGSLPVNWIAISKITDCGQAAKVVNSSQVDIFYRSGAVT
jgi:hypothetical protein